MITDETNGSNNWNSCFVISKTSYLYCSILIRLNLSIIALFFFMNIRKDIDINLFYSCSLFSIEKQQKNLHTCFLNIKKKEIEAWKKEVMEKIMIVE